MWSESVLLLLLIALFIFICVNALPCTFSCSIVNNANMKPVLTGPWCDSDSSGYAHGFFGLREICGLTCIELERLCDDDFNVNNGLLPEYLRRSFRDCCDDYKPHQCTICPEGVANKDSIVVTDLVISTVGDKILQFEASCLQIATYYDIEFGEDIVRCTNITDMVGIVEGCRCSSRAPTNSPAPTVSHLPSAYPTITDVPSQLPSFNPLVANVTSCEITWENLLEPNWRYVFTFIVLLVYFTPTYFLYRRVSEVFPQRRSKLIVLSKLLNDLVQIISITATTYYILQIYSKKDRCGISPLIVTIALQSFILFVDQIGELVALYALRHFPGQLYGDIDTITWQGFENFGHIPLFYYGYLVILPGFAGLISLSFIPSEADYSRPKLIAFFICNAILTITVLFAKNIYDGIYDNTSNVCNEMTPRVRCDRWNNADLVRPHCGPLWGGSERLQVIITSVTLNFFNLVLNYGQSSTFVILIISITLQLFRYLLPCISVADVILPESD